MFEGGRMELLVEAGSTLAAEGLAARFPSARAVGDTRDAHAHCVKIRLDGVTIPTALAVVRDWLVDYDIESTAVHLNERRYTLAAGGLGAVERGRDDDLPLDVVI